MIVTQLKMVPETIPFIIIGMVILKNAFIFEHSSEMAASSTVIGI